MHLVILLSGHGVALQELGVALVVLTCVLESCACLVHSGIHRAHVLPCCSDARLRGVASSRFTLQVSLCLCELQPVFAVFYYYQRIAFVHRLVFVEPYFLYESSHACVHRRDVLCHGGIVGIFTVAEMHEMVYHKPHSGYEDNEDECVVYRSQKFLLVHDFFFVYGFPVYYRINLFLCIFCF